MAIPRTSLLVLATTVAALAVTATGPAQATPRALPAVAPRAETAALHDDAAGGDADADDPAIWRNPADPDRSLVVATAKQGGLRVYDLDAREVQSPSPPRAPAPTTRPAASTTSTWSTAPGSATWP